MALHIVVEGIDGSGKGTQAKRLSERFQQTGKSCELLSFPRYDDTRFGAAIGDFLNGRFGKLNEVHPQLAALLYAGDRFESCDVLQRSLDENDVLVCDRYVPSNIAHQTSKLDGEERSELVAWIENLEYEIYQLPKPDIVILLDLPVRQAQQLIAKKDPRSYTEREADLQEADAGYLEGVRSMYLEVAASNVNWCLVSCLDGDRLRSIDEIHDEIWRQAQIS